MSDQGAGRARGRGRRGKKHKQQQQPNIPGLHLGAEGGQQRYIPGLPPPQQKQEQKPAPSVGAQAQATQADAPQGRGRGRGVQAQVGQPQQVASQQQAPQQMVPQQQAPQQMVPQQQAPQQMVPQQQAPQQMVGLPQQQAPELARQQQGDPRQTVYQQGSAPQAAYQQQYPGAQPLPAQHQGYQQEAPRQVHDQEELARQAAYQQQYAAAHQMSAQAAAQPEQQAYPQQQQAYQQQQQAYPQQQQAYQQQQQQYQQTGQQPPQAGGASGGRQIAPREGSGRPPIAQMRAMRLGHSEHAAYERYVEPVWKPQEKRTVGSFGNPINLVANYFQLNFSSEVVVFQYAVAFKPEIENIRMKCGLIKSVAAIIGEVTIFDGGILYLRRRLDKEPTVAYSTRESDGAQVEMTFSLKGTVTKDMPQMLHIVNTLFKKVQIALDMKKIRDHYFIPEGTIQVKKHKLEVMPGFQSSILHYEAGTLLGCDLIHKILRMDTVLDIMYEMYHSMNTNDLKAFRAKVLQAVVGMIVMTRFNSKTYRVDDIDWEARPTSTFEKKGEPITFVEYYKEAWNETVNDMDQPLLISRPTERDRRGGRTENVKLLPEMCFVTGLSDQARSDFNLMKDLAVHTRIGPEQRLTRLQDFLKQIDGSDKVKALLAPWDLTFSTSPVKVAARQLPPEQLLMRTSNKQFTKISYQSSEADWGRSMRNMHLLRPVHLDNWLLIFPGRCKGLVNDFIDCLIRVSKNMGLMIQQPTNIELDNDRNESYLLAIRQCLNPKVQMVVAVLPNQKKDRYDAIKKLCCIDNPVPSQVVLQKTLGRKQGLMSIAGKIAIQMNCKMGGEVWGGDIPLKGLMVIGMDSYHDSANKGHSVGAVVASLNKECTRYYSRTENHVTKEELMNNLTVLVTGAFKKFHEVNGHLPQKVVVYRDGVGDGQLKAVMKHEWPQIQRAFETAGGRENKPGAALVVVKKRILTRLFAHSREGLTNPVCGTIADQTVTKSGWYDFFLVSQSVRQGTVTPTSYNVITDTTGLQPDHLQRLTFKMTHLYFNWQGTVRVPAPCQYAHKLAFLQGQSLHREPAAILYDKLFYL